MGKFRQHAGRRNNAKPDTGVDQHSVSDGSRGAEQRGVCDAPADDRGRVIPMPASGIDPGRGRGDGIFDGECDVRGIDADRRGLYSSAPPELRRSADTAEFNAILNHPDILPMVAIAGQESLDATPLVGDPKNYLLMVDGYVNGGELAGKIEVGAIFFAQHDPGIFEVHTHFLKGWRGQFAIDASLAAYRWMFTHTDAMTLLARAPDCWPQIGKFCIAVGATKEFERHAFWLGPDGLSDCAFYALRYDDWVNQAELVSSGHQFYLKLRDEFARTGHELPPLEYCLDQRLGAFIETLYGNQPDKAVILYNRFARFSGFPGIALLARDPIIIDIGTSVLQIGDGTFKVLKIR